MEAKKDTGEVQTGRTVSAEVEARENKRAETKGSRLQVPILLHLVVSQMCTLR